MKKFIAEFKEFASRGNVIDMAIGVIMGGSFGKITTSLVNDLLMPVISWIFGARDMSALNVIVRPAELNAAGEVVKEAITIGFGTFVGTIIDFLLIALTAFLIVKFMNKAHSLMEKKQEEEQAAEPPKPTSEELLAQILEEIKSK